jgi:hypothetical protein
MPSVLYNIVAIFEADFSMVVGIITNSIKDI